MMAVKKMRVIRRFVCPENISVMLFNMFVVASIGLLGDLGI